MKIDLKGAVFSVLSTFHSNGIYDPVAEKECIDFLIKKGAGGIFILATAGQGPLLPVEDRKIIAKTVLDAVDGRVPTVVMCGAPGTIQTTELIRQAIEDGADIIASLPPMYSRLDFEAYCQHFEAVKKAAGDKPVMVYNNPWAQGRALTVDELLELNRLGYIDGVTDSSRDLGSIYKLVEHNDKLFCAIADTKLSFPGILVGCHCLCSAIGNAIPELFVEMFNAVQTGDIKKAIAYELKVFKISESLRSPECGAIHYALNLRGVNAGYPRAPIRCPNDKEKAIIESVMAEFK